jgi:hypothetical protein
VPADLFDRREPGRQRQHRRSEQFRLGGVPLGTLAVARSCRPDRGGTAKVMRQPGQVSSGPRIPASAFYGSE